MYVQGLDEGKLCILQTLSYRNMNSPPLCTDRLVNYSFLMRVARILCSTRKDGYVVMQAFEVRRKYDSECRETNQRFYHAINYACCVDSVSVVYIPYQCEFWDNFDMWDKCNSIAELERYRNGLSYSCFVRSYIYPNVTVPNLMVSNDGCPNNKYKLIKSACCIKARYTQEISTLLPLTGITRRKTTRQTWRPYATSTTITTSLLTRLTTSTERRSNTKEHNDNTPTETKASSEMSTDAVFGVAFTVIIFLLLIGITVFIVIKKRKRNRNKPVVIDNSKHDFTVKSNESKIMEPENMYHENIEQSCHFLSNRSEWNCRNDRSPNQIHDMRSLVSSGSSSRQDIQRHDTVRRESRHDMNQRPSRLDTSRQTYRHDIGRQSSRRRSRHDMERHGSRADTTTPNVNPLEVLASVLMLGEQSSNRRTKHQQKDASYTNVASRRTKSSKSKRKSKRRSGDVNDDYTDNKSVTQTAKRRKSPKKH